MTIPCDLRRDGFGRLVFAAADGRVHENVQPVRAFPLSAADAGIALLSAEGKEVFWAPRLAELPEAARRLFEEEFVQREFMPVIERIVAVTSYATPSTWQVATDRGATTLVLKSEDDIRRLPTPGALLVADSNGIHYLIRDRARLDPHSQRILKRFL